MLSSSIGGIAIASGRADRSSDFMSLLPIQRWQIVLSKCIAAIIVLVAAHRDGEHHTGNQVALRLGLITLGTGLCGFTCGTIYCLRRIAP